MIEAFIEDETVAAAVANGWFARKLKWIGRDGAPDHFFAKEGRIVLVEFKRPGERPQPHQAREHRKLRQQGVETLVIDNLEEGLAFARA